MRPQTHNSVTQGKAQQESAVAILLTGERGDGQYVVHVYGAVAKHTCKEFRTLLALVVARGATTSGFRPVARLDVHRLRNAWKKAIGAAGHNLLQRGTAGWYRIAPMIHDVALDEGFLELPPTDVPPHFMNDLKRLCRVVKRS